MDQRCGRLQSAGVAGRGAEAARPTRSAGKGLAGQTMASLRWPESAGRVIDRAVTLLDQEGLSVLDEDARLLLGSSGAIRAEHQHRLCLRSGFVRRSLRDLPAAFSLHDREGRRAHVVAGGLSPGRLVTLHATLTCARTIKADQVREPGAQPSGIRLPGNDSDGIGAFDLVGCAPPLADTNATHGDLHRLFTNLLTAPRPQLIRPRAGDVLDGLGLFLARLRGSTSAAEAKPYVVCEAVADGPLSWGGTACRVLLRAARQGIPVAPVAGPPVAPDGLDRWVVEATAGMVGALVLHRCGRRGAPVLWGVPLLQLHGPRPDSLAALRLLLEAGRELSIPTLATVVPPTTPGPADQRPGDLAPLWALQAAARGAAIVAWAGLCDDGHTLDLGQLARHAHQVPALRQVLNDAAPGPAPAPHDPVDVDSDLVQGLADVVRGMSLETHS